MRVKFTSLLRSSSDTVGDRVFDLDDVDLPELTTPQAECDRILGEYMNGWHQVEIAVADAVETILGLDHFRASLIVGSLQMSALKDILLLTASNYVPDNQLKPFVKAMEELKALTGVRNKLVHGSWTVHVKVEDGTHKPISAELARTTMTWDGEAASAMQDPSRQNYQHLRDKMVFRPAGIQAETLKLRPFAQTLKSLLSLLKVERQPDKRQSRPAPKQQIQQKPNDRKRRRRPPP
jgi:hypothetical protein